MGEVKVYRIFITPQTKVNVSENEKWMFSPQITDQYLLEFGMKKHQKQVTEGKKNPINPKAYYNRKRYILKYYEYKKKVRELFYQTGLKSFPESNVWFKFYVPMPKSWSRKKRAQHLFEKHQSMCDASNLHKSLEDACSDNDKKNWDYRASKFWYDGAEGFIEIIIDALEPAIGYTKFEKPDKIK